MPCDTVDINEVIGGQPRAEQIKTALERLEKALALGTVKAVIGRNGAIAFAGWAAADRAGVGDVCAYRRLTNAGSAQLRRAMVRAEALAGRTADKKAITQGVHSHDGGQTWGRDK